MQPLKSDKNPSRDEVTPALRRLMLNGFALAPAGANVIMQLSHPGVGHGVIESRVDSGSLYQHPLKRTRTTLSYIVLAVFGTPDERMALRHAVNAQHRQVRSRPGDAVAYNAFDPELQLWVAACMYRGVTTSVAFLHGEQDDATRDALYRVCARFATTLQVPEALWPADRAAFELYWSRAIASIEMDATTRGYLRDLASLGFLPRPLRHTLGPLHQFITVGFLEPVFREQLGYRWGPRRQLVFDVLLRAMARVNGRLPRVVRELPWNIVLYDARRRIAGEKPLV